MLPSLEGRDVHRAFAAGQRERGPQSPDVESEAGDTVGLCLSPTLPLSLLLPASGLLCTHLLDKLGMSAG